MNQKISTLRRITIAFVLIASVVAMGYLCYSQYRQIRINSLINSTEGSDDYLDGHISRDGKWFLSIDFAVRMNDHETNEVTISSIDNPFQKSLFAVDEQVRYQFIMIPLQGTESWSPSGGAFFLAIPSLKSCGDDFIELLFEEDGRWSHSKIVEDPNDERDCYQPVWSEDGTKLAIYPVTHYIENGMTNIRLYNQKGELIQDLDVNVPETRNSVNQLYWNDEDFLIVTAAFYSQFGNQPEPTLIYRFSSSNPEKVQLLAQLPDYYYLIGKDPNSERILLTAYSLDEDFCESIVFNLNSQQIEKTVRLQGACANDHRSPDNRYIVLATGKEENLLLHFWDWTKLEFYDAGEADEVISWQTDMQALLVMNKTENGKVKIEYVKPN